MSFTQEQRAAVESSGKVSMTIDGIECVVLRADLLNRVRPLIVDELNHDELNALLAATAADSDWLDPSMDIYDRYDEHR